MNFVTFCNKPVKSAKNTICDICARNSLRYEFCDNFAQTLVLRRNMVTSAKNTFCDTCAQNSWRYDFVTFLLIQ